MFVNYCYWQRISRQTDTLSKSHGIEASYITVHSYDILVINTRPWLRLGTGVITRYHTRTVI